jgi:hypothetical protein
MNKQQWLFSLGLSAMLVGSPLGCDVRSQVRVFSPKAALCQEKLPAVKPFVPNPRLVLHSSVSQFPRIEAALRASEYRAAAKLMHDFEGYPAGSTSTALYPQGEYLFEGAYRAAFVAAYQSSFCFVSSQLDYSARSRPDVAATYAKALEAAVAGDYGAAASLARKAYQDSGKYLGEALLIAGEVEAAAGHSKEARLAWLATLDVHGYPAPGRDSDFIAPPRIAAAEYLVHFRP